jgi:hypothetical protein
MRAVKEKGLFQPGISPSNITTSSILMVVFFYAYFLLH